MAALHERSPCKRGGNYGRSARRDRERLGGVLRAARDDHGFTVPLLNSWPEMWWRAREKTSAGPTVKERIDGPRSRYTLTGELLDDDEIRNFYENDIIELDEADDRAEIVFGEWLTETLLHGFFCQEENEGAAQTRQMQRR